MPSQRDVPTYDHKPQMSARQVADAFVRAFSEDHPRFSIINFANADMVGHTGVIAATITAVQTVDTCLGDVAQAVHGAGGVCVITADHGNAEQMLEPNGDPSTAHSLQQGAADRHRTRYRAGGQRLSGRCRADDLELLGIEQPGAMSGRSLLEPAHARRQVSSV